MAKIYPFRGYRYNESKTGNLAGVVTQPYDKIPEELRQDYLSRHPVNVVRIIKNRNYREAARFWKDWIKLGYLVRDETPSIYVYSQEFEIEGRRWIRTGFIGLVSLEDPDLVVRGHERVLDKPLQDRLNLIRETEANEGLIFGMFSDPERSVDGCLEDFTRGRADIEVTDDFGVINRLWCISDPGAVAKVQSILRDRALYIADGHHRYQTSVLFHRECREKGWKPRGEESFDKRMIALFNMDSQGMRVLATHRAVKNLENPNPAGLLSSLCRHFEVRRVEDDRRLESLLDEEAGIGLVIANPYSGYFLQVRDGSLNDSAFMPGTEGIARQLDVNLLHEGILGPLLGIDAERLASQEFVDYFRDRGELLEKIRRGEYQLGFFLRPTTLEQVRLASEAGFKMPQKSTDFFPKLLTGLVMMKMEIEKADET